MARVIGIMPNQEQVGGLIDSLKNAGFDRKDMVVASLSRSFTEWENPDEIAYLKTERDELWQEGTDTYTDFLAASAGQGVAVAVEAPRHELARIREIMEQNGAAKIIQD
ncbi:Uncharacterized [Moorella glycerini]|uniref:Uncharacterized protein n=1 Tax=Neomoorella stamsii TaxID=1266720 RepID=A0A9X7J6X5_9FIRM|nr:MULTISPECIES: hypothetical protein [Moorella]PRR77856.1 hypothetical protein MOST_00500 [Moorella stamsii]CEP68965.1 Uncharacterized [Moorella glycerini]